MALRPKKELGATGTHAPLPPDPRLRSLSAQSALLVLSTTRSTRSICPAVDSAWLRPPLGTLPPWAPPPPEPPLPHWATTGPFPRTPPPPGPLPRAPNPPEPPPPWPLGPAWAVAAEGKAKKRETPPLAFAFAFALVSNYERTQILSTIPGGRFEPASEVPFCRQCLSSALFKWQMKINLGG